MKPRFPNQDPYGVRWNTHLSNGFAFATTTYVNLVGVDVLDWVEETNKIQKQQLNDYINL